MRHASALQGLGGAGPAASARLRRWTLLGYWTLIFTLTHWPGLDDLVPDALDWPHQDKLVHFGMYAGWIVVWWWVLSAGRHRVRGAVFLCLLAGGAAYGLFDELTQVIVSRDFELLDWAADVGGMAAAILLLLAWQRRTPAAVSRAGKADS